ncbi:MAG: nucleotidyltransferase family protein [Alistipes sp.]|nr:nucleotidyltransferase family protein [Alistipes sp.]
MPITNIIEERLLALVRIALWQSDVPVTLFDGMNDSEWEAVYNKSVEQGVLAVAFDGVKTLPARLQPTLDVKVQWGFNVQYIEKVYNRQLDTATRLTALYAKHGIRTMILKGLTNAANYPTPAHRQFGDIDIYLMGDYERGNKIIEERGIKIKHDYFVHTEFSLGGINVENHHVFVNHTVNRTGRYVQQRLSELAPDSRSHPTVAGAVAPSAEFDALFLTRHSSWHYSRECIRLRDLCDWAMFLYRNSATMEKEAAVRMLAECDMERYASILTDICHNYLGLPAEYTLPFSAHYPALVERVIHDILTFDNPEKHNNINFVKAFVWKIRNRLSRKWCYDEVVVDSFWGNIGYSIKNYLRHPFEILRAKL